MDRWQKAAAAFIAVLVAGVGVFSVGFRLGRDARPSVPRAVEPSDQDAFELIREAFEEIMNSSVERPDAGKLARAAIRAMIRELREADDPYALFYSPKSYREFQELATGTFNGIGVWLKPKERGLEIVSVLPRTPALRSGLQSGDVIREVNGKEIDPERVDDVIARIKGEAGTKVEILIDRRGSELTFSITREEIDLPNLRTKVTDGDIGHLRLFGFGRRAGVQVARAVKGLLDEGVTGIVLDLRDNGGGLFSEAVNVASVFVEDGDIVIYRDGVDDDVVYEAEGDAFEDVPLVVLVNEGTASSSEIVAGALKVNERAQIVGTTTFGKGTVQEVIALSDSSAFKVTSAAYLMPDERDIDGRGISPDVVIDARPRVQLTRAIDILRALVASSGGSQG